MPRPMLYSKPRSSQCKQLRMPMMRPSVEKLAEQAVKQKKSHVGYLEALLAAEVEERERHHRATDQEAHLPRVKTLEEFDFAQSPRVTAAKMRELAEGGYIERAEPVLFIGECGTGKTHLARAVRGGLPAEEAGALHHGRRPGQRTGGSQAPTQLRRVLARWAATI